MADVFVVADFARRPGHHQIARFPEDRPGRRDRARAPRSARRSACSPLLAIEHAQDPEQFLHDQRREPERRLVEQHQLAAAASARGRPRASAARRPRACRPAGGGAPSGAGNSRKPARCRRRSARRRARVMAPSCRFSSTRHGARRCRAPAARGRCRAGRCPRWSGRRSSGRRSGSRPLVSDHSGRAHAASWSCRRHWRRAAW